MAKRKSRSRRSKPSRSRAAASTARVEATKKVDLATEYHYVVEDLSRIGIIAAILIGGLVILSFLL